MNPALHVEDVAMGLQTPWAVIIGVSVAFVAMLAPLAVLIVRNERRANRRDDGWTCGRADCGQANPPDARFCRRCGDAMPTGPATA